MWYFKYHACIFQIPCLHSFSALFWHTHTQLKPQVHLFCFNWNSDAVQKSFCGISCICQTALIWSPRCRGRKIVQKHKNNRKIIWEQAMTITSLKVQATMTQPYHRKQMITAIKYVKAYPMKHVLCSLADLWHFTDNSKGWKRHSRKKVTSTQ